MTSSNDIIIEKFYYVIKCQSIKYILLDNLGKHNLLMKFGQFMSYY